MNVRQSFGSLFTIVLMLVAVGSFSGACGDSTDDSGSSSSEQYEDCYDCCESKGLPTLNTMCADPSAGDGPDSEGMCRCQRQSIEYAECPGVCEGE